MRRSNPWLGIGAFVVALAVALGAGGTAEAHEGHEHELQGTVKSLEETKLELTATDGKVVAFAIDGQTKFLRGASAVKRDEVQVDERAVVKYRLMGEMKHAFEVKLAEKRS